MQSWGPGGGAPRWTFVDFVLVEGCVIDEWRGVPRPAEGPGCTPGNLQTGTSCLCVCSHISLFMFWTALRNSCFIASQFLLAWVQQVLCILTHRLVHGLHCPREFWGCRWLGPAGWVEPDPQHIHPQAGACSILVWVVSVLAPVLCILPLGQGTPLWVMMMGL